MAHLLDGSAPMAYPDTMLMPPPSEPPPLPASPSDLPYHLRKRSNRGMVLFFMTMLAFFVLTPMVSFALGQQQFDLRSRAGYADPNCPANRQYVCFGEKPALAGFCKETGTWNAYRCGATDDRCEFRKECELMK